METGNRYSISVGTDLAFEDAVGRARALLAENGYGVVTEMDVRARFREKLGIEREPYMILGACNPSLASFALEEEPDLGVLLPCNVVVYTKKGRTIVSAVEPETMLSVVGNDALAEVSRRVRDDLTRVVETLAAG